MAVQKILCFLSENQHLHAQITQEPLVVNYEWIVKPKPFLEQISSGSYDLNYVYYLIGKQTLDSLKSYQIDMSKVICVDSDFTLDQIEELVKAGVDSFFEAKAFSMQKLSEKLSNHTFSNKISQDNTHKHILVIDDIASNLMILKHHLKNNANYIIHTGENASDCFSVLAQQHIDLIILDIQMPGMNGYEIARILKQNMFYKDIPIIFLTANQKDAQHVKEAIMDLGVIDYLYKPIDERIIQAKVDHFLRMTAYKNQLEKSHALLDAQKTLLDQNNKAIIDNIEYAKKIQTAILPTKNELDNVFKTHFLFYQAKDILSGDFYYCKQLNEKVLWILGDCTGHGVSGALMTMTVHTLLNTIILEKQQMSTAQILEQLHHKLYAFLHNDSKEATKDGVEIGLVLYDQVQNTFEFSGANISLWLLRPQKNAFAFPVNAEELTKNVARLEPNKVVLGQPIYEVENLKSHVFENQGYILMMKSDGLVDQIGEKNNERFKSHRLLEALGAEGDFSTEKIGLFIQSEFENWKGANSQTDDVSFWITQI